MQRHSARRRHGVLLSFVLTFAVLYLCPQAAGAHDTIDEQIARVTGQIATRAPNAELFVRRADLHRESRHWTDALADLDRAASLDPTMTSVDLVRARVLFDAGRTKDAVDSASRFLERQPNHAGGLIVRARARARLGLVRDADADFVSALALQPLPELYIERARLLRTSGRAGMERGVQALDEGVARLGPIVTLELEAIDLDIRLKRYEAALARVNRASAQTPRKEEWLARRGVILERAGRAAEAREAYQSALSALSTLPSWTQATPASGALRTRLQNDLRRLAIDLHSSRWDRQ
jgi:tetratricopeptide (TPR) repeat protein